MAIESVTFKREFSGKTVNVWIHHPRGITEKLIFTNGFASSSLQKGRSYILTWVAAGPVGSELKIQKRFEGGSFSPLIASWKIPPKEGAAAGQILVRTDQIEFEV